MVDIQLEPQAPLDVADVICIQLDQTCRIDDANGVPLCAAPVYLTSVLDSVSGTCMSAVYSHVIPAGPILLEAVKQALLPKSSWRQIYASSEYDDA